MVFGDEYGIWGIFEREYGQFAYAVAYFVTSPLIVMAIAYFAKEWMATRSATALILLLLNCLGMALSGTRNNLIVAFLMPFVVFFWYSRNKLLPIGAFLLFVVPLALYGVSTGAFRVAFDPSEYSNHIKFQHLADYSAILSKPDVFLIGNGLGSRFLSTGFGIYTSVTELSFLEFIRSYGIVVCALLVALILRPLSALAKPQKRESHFIFLAYLFYLYLCALNPLLMSSTGLLLLSIVVVEYFRPEGPVELRRATAGLSGPMTSEGSVW